MIGDQEQAGAATSGYIRLDVEKVAHYSDGSDLKESAEVVTGLSDEEIEVRAPEKITFSIYGRTGEGESDTSFDAPGTAEWIADYDDLETALSVADQLAGRMGIQVSCAIFGCQKTEKNQQKL